MIGVEDTKVAIILIMVEIIVITTITGTKIAIITPISTAIRENAAWITTASTDNKTAPTAAPIYFKEAGKESISWFAVFISVILDSTLRIACSLAMERSCI